LIQGFGIAIHVRISILKLFSECWPVGRLQWQVGLFKLRYPVAQTSSYATV